MSAISRSVLCQTSRLHYLNLNRRAFLPFSTSVKSLAEAEQTSAKQEAKQTTTSNQSFDSVRK